jgi:hypothetical protein
MIRSYDALVTPVPTAGLLGRHVVTPDDESLGSIRHVVSSGFGGGVAYVVVAAGTPDTGTKMFAMPPAVFGTRAGTDECVLDIAMEQIQQASDNCPWLSPHLSNESSR